MCYMAVYPPGVLPDPEDLRKGAQLNPHGLGWCVGTDETVRLLPRLAVYPPSVAIDPEPHLSGETLNPRGHGSPFPENMEPEARSGVEVAIVHFMAARISRPNEPAVFHARYATGGSVSLANCQPLVLEDGTILAHNGALFPVDGPESDTRIFGERYLPHWDLDVEEDRKQLRALLGRNKMVILRPGKVPVLLGDRLGVWRRDGSWHSNYDYTGISHVRPDACPSCASYLTPRATPRMCAECNKFYTVRRMMLGAALMERSTK